MAHKRGAHRYRRGRFQALTRLLCLALMLGAVAAALTIFFKAETILVEGNLRYTQEEILAASGIETGDNLFLLNKVAAVQSICDALPYIESASIRRGLPSTLRISVTECRAAAAVSDGAGGFWFVSIKGKLLEQSGVRPEGLPLVTGETVQAGVPGGALRFADGGETRLEALLTLLDAAQQQGVLSGLGGVELSDDTRLRFTYLNRFTVELPWDSDYGRRLRYLLRTVEELEDNQTGTINLMVDGKSSYIPGEPPL